MSNKILFPNHILIKTKTHVIDIEILAFSHSIFIFNGNFPKIPSKLPIVKMKNENDVGIDFELITRFSFVNSMHRKSNSFQTMRLY